MMEWRSDGIWEKTLAKSAQVTNWQLAITPTALNSKAQCRAAHAGSPITHKTEPQRGSTIGAPGRSFPPSVLSESSVVFF